MRYKLRWLPFALFIAILVGPKAEYCQTKDRSDRSAQARTIVQLGLDSLGGIGGWKGIGAATATKTVVSGPAKGTTIELIDDWSQSKLRYKHVTHTGNDAKSIVVSDGNRTIRQNPRNNSHAVQRGTDESILVGLYPGLVLARALENAACQFEFADQPDQLHLSVPITGPEVDIIYQSCTSSAGQGALRMTWRFLKENHRPYSVEQLPIRTNGTASSEVIRFDSFLSINSVVIPNRLSVTGPSGTEQSIEISNITLSKSIDIDFGQEFK